MNYQDLDDAQVLAHADVFGPAIVGHYLWERAEWVKVHNPLGARGRDAMDVKYVPSEKALADLRARGMLRDEPGPVVPDVPVKRGPGRPRKDAV